MNLSWRVIFLSVLIVILNSNFSQVESSAYGYKIGIGPVELSNPIRILSYQGADYFAGASWVNGRWYAVTHLTRNLVICDTNTGQNTVIGNIGIVNGEPVALCWDPTTYILFLLTASPNNLYSVNINTGTASFVASVNLFPQYSLLSGAISNGGSLFAILHTGDNSNPYLIKINKTTGEGQVRGVMFGGASQGPQGIAFDRSPGGFLWWVRYRTTGESVLMFIDTVSAQITSALVLPDSTQIDGFIFTDNIVGISNTSDVFPEEFSLSQNFPNPFNPATIIKYDLPKDVKVTVKIYDLLGREVTTLVNNEFKHAGRYQLNWNAGKYASGVYIYRIEVRQAGSATVDYVSTKKMVVLK